MEEIDCSCIIYRNNIVPASKSSSHRQGLFLNAMEMILIFVSLYYSDYCIGSFSDSWFIHAKLVPVGFKLA